MGRFVSLDGYSKEQDYSSMQRTCSVRYGLQILAGGFSVAETLHNEEE